MTDWRLMGRESRRDGMPRTAAPSLPEPRRLWLQGYDEADREGDPAPTSEILEVSLQLRDGVLRLVDGHGREIGRQAHVVLQQADEPGRYHATVTFADLPIVRA